MMVDVAVIEDALEGCKTPDQTRIAAVGMEWLRTLIQKNGDYGSSVWKEPFLCPGLDVAEAIFVRMTDKVERIRQLRQRQAEVTSESLDDTIADLGSYCLLYLARPVIVEEKTDGGN